MKRLIILLFLSILFMGCTREESSDERNYQHYERLSVNTITKKLLFTPKEPTILPFEVDVITASLVSFNKYEENSGEFQEVVFHYDNKNAKPLLKLIITYNGDLNLPTGEKVSLRDNLIGIYSEDSESQSIWWIEDNLLYRYVYFIDGDQAELKKEKFIEIVNSME